MKSLTIGHLAKQAGVNLETVRYYERRGLLPRPPRSASGYRLFPAEAARRLRFIRRAQELGFSLREISELLTLRVDPDTTCGEVKQRADDKIADIEGNKYFSNDVFLGTGISFWDLTRSETFTPAWLVHFGIPLNKGSKTPVYFMGEGRLFFDNIDSASSNYNFWGGIRVHFGGK